MGAIGFSSAIADDRFVYFPSIGILLIIGWVFCLIWDSDKAVRHLAIRRAAIVSLVMVIIRITVATPGYPLGFDWPPEIFAGIVSALGKAQL
jgi:hypothetical protein